MNQRTKYIAEIHHAREVCLHGTADLAFWSDRLHEQELEVASENNRASLIFTAVEARWMGITFCELSIGVHVRAKWNVGHEEGIFLVQAFNSSRLFTFCERRFFHTPYYRSNVQLSVNFPASILAGTTDQEFFSAEMQGDEKREPTPAAHESWEGPIYLPSLQPEKGLSRRLFWAKLAGVTETYPVSASDRFRFHSTRQQPVLGWLTNAGFAAERWSVRHSATHARSRTFSIDEK